MPAAGQQGEVEAEKVASASPMKQVEGFFMALTSNNTDGRVVVNNQGGVIMATINCFKGPLIKNATFVFLCRILGGEQH